GRRRPHPPPRLARPRAGERSWARPTTIAAMHRAFRGVAALLVLGLAAPACSGNDPDREAAPSTTAAPATGAPSTTEAPSTTAAEARTASSAQFQAAKGRLVRGAEVEAPRGT